MPFRLNAKNIFCTYPQCDLPKSIVANYLFTKFDPQYVIVASELHQDGTPHLHAVICFKSKKNFKSSNFADLDCTPGEHFHGNYQSVRSLSDTFNYVTKDDETPCEIGVRPTSSTKKASFDDIVSQALSSCATKSEFIKFLIDNAGGQLAKSFSQVSAFAEYVYSTPTKHYQAQFSDFANIPPELSEWVSDNIMGPFCRGFRPKSLVLVGKTRLGKTEWARSLGPHVYFNTLVDFKEWLPTFKSGDYQYVIFDDFSYDSFKYSYKQWFGGQKSITVTDKYCKKFSFEHGKPCIFLTNEYPRWEDIGYDWDWCKGNVLIVEIDNALY